MSSLRFSPTSTERKKLCLCGPGGEHPAQAQLPAADRRTAADAGPERPTAAALREGQTARPRQVVQRPVGQELNAIALKLCPPPCPPSLRRESYVNVDDVLDRKTRHDPCGPQALPFADEYNFVSRPFRGRRFLWDRNRKKKDDNGSDRKVGPVSVAFSRRCPGSLFQGQTESVGDGQHGDVDALVGGQVPVEAADGLGGSAAVALVDDAAAPQDVVHGHQTAAAQQLQRHFVVGHVVVLEEEEEEEEEVTSAGFVVESRGRGRNGRTLSASMKAKSKVPAWPSSSSRCSVSSAGRSSSRILCATPASSQYFRPARHRRVSFSFQTNFTDSVFQVKVLSEVFLNIFCSQKDSARLCELCRVEFSKVFLKCFSGRVEKNRE